MTNGKALISGSFLLLATLALVSCGNGKNNHGGNFSTPDQAQGVYVGTTSSGLTYNAIVLPDDMFYAIYGNTSGNLFNVCGIATGQGASNNGKYTASENDFAYCGGSSNVYSGTVSATYSAGSTLNGSMTENNTSVMFTGTAPTASLYNYNAAALISAISGSWSGSLTDGESATVSIDSLGNASGISRGGCSFTGTIRPDGSNKNFFDVSLTFGASPCLMPNQKATGIAVNYLLSDGVTNQFLAGVSSGNSMGIVFAAERSNFFAPSTLTAISVGPQNFILNINQTQQMWATGTYGDGSQKTLTSGVTWSSSDSNAVSVGQTSGVVTGVAAGNATITARSPGSCSACLGSTTVTVALQGVTSITVSPSNQSVTNNGTAVFFTAMANGSTDITNTATWTVVDSSGTDQSSNFSISFMSGSGESFLPNSNVAVGTYTVKATYTGIAATATLNVN